MRLIPFGLISKALIIQGIENFSMSLSDNASIRLPLSADS
jgi:hypothetical protein